ncbi:MAG: MFS transporter [Chloroflexi bacterium]|nr:MFS transporter [Chloroflexota bacterium]
MNADRFYAAEVIWGFLTPFVRRSYVLAFGNVVMSVGTLLTSLVGSFPGLVITRTVYSVGASAQHPIGSSLLSGYFPRSRGSVLALNSSIAAVGSLLPAPLAALLLALYGWRAAFVLGALAAMVMAVGYLVRPDRRHAEAAGGWRTKPAEGNASYRRVVRNRNLIVISILMMLGAAGRTGGVNQAYLGVHFQEDLGMSLAAMGVALAVVQLGSIFGPVGFGWLSDRSSRKLVMQASLFLSAIATGWLAVQTGERLRIERGVAIGPTNSRMLRALVRFAFPGCLPQHRAIHHPSAVRAPLQPRAATRWLSVHADPRAPQLFLSNNGCLVPEYVVTVA